MTAMLRERPVEQTAALQIADCDIHPKVRSLEDLRPWLSNRWWDHLQTYGQRSRHGFAKGSPYPKGAPHGVPARRLAGIRRRARQRPRAHARAAARCLRGHARHPQSALDRAGSSERRVQRRDVLRDERMAEGGLDRTRAAPSRLGARFLRGRRGRARRDRAPRRRSRLRPGAPLEPHRRAARPEALLADLRGCGRSRPAGRHPRLRLQRLADERRLAVLLHRGDDRARRVRPGGRDQPDLRGRLRAVPGSADRR